MPMKEPVVVKTIDHSQRWSPREGTTSHTWLMSIRQGSASEKIRIRIVVAETPEESGVFLSRYDDGWRLLHAATPTLPKDEPTFDAELERMMRVARALLDLE